MHVLATDYERDKLRPCADVVAKIGQALGVTTDELLGLAPIAKAPAASHHLLFLRRLELIDQLPKRDQDALLRAIDAFLGRAKAG